MLLDWFFGNKKDIFTQHYQDKEHNKLDEQQLEKDLKTFNNDSKEFLEALKKYKTDKR